MLDNSVLVTVAIPAFNSESTLPLAIRSVFAQTYRNWELIILDDGSTDRTLETIQQVSDPRVRVISDGQNRGLAYRLNQATEESSGSLLFRMDADDIMHPRRIEKQVEFLKSNPDIDIVGTAAAIIDASNQITGVRGYGPLPRTPLEIFRKGLLIHPSIAGRRAWFQNNPYDETYRRAEDYELWCRTAGTLRAAKIEEPLLFYRDGYSGLDAYKSNLIYARNAILRHGPQKIGHLRSKLLLSSLWVKKIVHNTAAHLNVRELIIRRRTRKTSDSILRALSAALTEVLNTDVPGLIEFQERERISRPPSR